MLAKKMARRNVRRQSPDPAASIAGRALYAGSWLLMLISLSDRGQDPRAARTGPAIGEARQEPKVVHPPLDRPPWNESRAVTRGPNDESPPRLTLVEARERDACGPCVLSMGSRDPARA